MALALLARLGGGVLDGILLRLARLGGGVLDGVPLCLCVSVGALALALLAGCVCAPNARPFAKLLAVKGRTIVRLSESESACPRIYQRTLGC